VTSPTPTNPGPLARALIAGSFELSGHGSAVRGSIGIGTAGRGGRLAVELLAKASAIGAHGSKQVVVGRVVRSSLSTGTLPFTVSLSSRAKTALRRHHKLALSVKLVLTPREGSAESLARALTLRA